MRYNGATGNSVS